MANTLGVYNPIFYAQEALIQLENALGMAGRIHRGYDAERRAFGKSDVISIRRPSTFTAQDAPSTAQNVATETVNVTLDQWKEVKFALTDKELTISEDRIIEDHIRPAAYALADNIDATLCGLYADVPHSHSLNASPGSVVGDIVTPRATMFDNKVPLGDPNKLHYMCNGTLEAGFLANAAFAQWQGAGQTGAATQMRGAMGQRYGMNLFANQNVKTHTSGTADDTALEIVGTGAVGDTTVALDAADAGVAGTIVPGDVLLIGGRKYAATTTSTAAGNAFASVGISPPLKAVTADNDSVTLTTTDSTGENLMFHENFACLATAPLSDMASALGARVSSITDEASRLSIRSRVYYDGDNSKVNVALDVLWGYKTLDPDLAVRCRD